MSDYPHVSIIILHWKNLADTRHCLSAVRQLTYPSYDVYVVLNGASREDSISIHNLYDQYDNFTIIDEEENIGFAEGNNVAIRLALKQSNPEYVFALNNDTEIEPHALDEAVAKAQEGFDEVQLLMMNFENRSLIDKAGIRIGKSLLPFDIKELGTESPIVCASAGAALYSSKLLETIAIKRQHASGFANTVEKEYFDSDFFAYAEDLDLGLRARLAGFDCALAEKAIVYHKGSASTSTMSDFAIYHTFRNLIWTYIKNTPRAWMIRFGVFFIIGQLGILYKNFTRGQHKQILRAWKDAKRDKSVMQLKRAYIQKQSSNALDYSLVDKTLF
ncbi:MAG: glycosyltransferase family 2 protein [Patescibacteria group bacterium]